MFHHCRNSIAYFLYLYTPKISRRVKLFCLLRQTFIKIENCIFFRLRSNHMFKHIVNYNRITGWQYQTAKGIRHTARCPLKLKSTILVKIDIGWPTDMQGNNLPNPLVGEPMQPDTRPQWMQAPSPHQYRLQAPTVPWPRTPVTSNTTTRSVVGWRRSKLKESNNDKNWVCTTLFSSLVSLPEDHRISIALGSLHIVRR